MVNKISAGMGEGNEKSHSKGDKCVKNDNAMEIGLRMFSGDSLLRG